MPAIGQTRSAGSPVPLFNIRDFGAVGDARTIDSAAINRAVDRCSAAGGGIVYVPAGTYLCGTIVLKSNVTLYLEAAATILGSSDINDYTIKTRNSALKNHDENPTHLIFAQDAENVSVAGTGLIDGQGPAFWVPSDRKALAPEDAWRNAAAFVNKPLPRPSPLLEFYNCKNLRIEDIRIQNAPGWTLRPICCDKVFIRGIIIKNPVVGPNTDGIDVTCSRNVFISDCLIDTGDDCICLKSEDPYQTGKFEISKNIVISNCVLTTCCNGFKFGTGTHGGFENITFTNSVIFNDDVSPAARVISGIEVAVVDGGYIDGVVISNIRMHALARLFLFAVATVSPQPMEILEPFAG